MGREDARLEKHDRYSREFEKIGKELGDAKKAENAQEPQNLCQDDDDSHTVAQIGQIRAVFDARMHTRKQSPRKHCPLESFFEPSLFEHWAVERELLTLPSRPSLVKRTDVFEESHAIAIFSYGILPAKSMRNHLEMLMQVRWSQAPNWQASRDGGLDAALLSTAEQPHTSRAIICSRASVWRVHGACTRLE